MTRYTYKVIPAPSKGRKAPGVKGAEARFAHGLEEAMNEMAAQGWEYLRADILPSEERQGLTSTNTVYRSVLVFRREAKGTGSAERPVPSLTARRGPPPEEELKFTRREPITAVATETGAPDAEDLPETDTEERAANDDAPVRIEDEEALSDTPETEPETEEAQDDTTDDTREEEDGETPRR
ncbi:MAG: hypothetical protein RIA08_16040 [Roseovarius sp.]|uniref:hypothetical protein n=1 Tax=Roseobacteraceae TaxID=2854170 RepID=UPI0032EF9113